MLGAERKNDVMRKFENEKVDKGLTHIKYNKYAPSADDASAMTDREFRDAMMQNMKEAELERRKEQGGVIGGAASDNYLEALSSHSMSQPIKRRYGFDYKENVENAVFMVKDVTRVMDPLDYIAAMNWRYAVKKFDNSKKLTVDIMQTIEESLRLTPSSFGLQPWKFLVIENSEIREVLKEHSYSQSQITDSSALVVLLSKTDFNEADVNEYFNQMLAEQGQDPQKLEGYRQTILKFFSYKDNEGIRAWVTTPPSLALFSPSQKKFSIVFFE